MSEDSPTEAFGPYLVYEKLGVGGMAQVHRAIAAHAQFQRPVALKRMLSHIADNEEMVKSFVREARLASYLRHENVAETYDLGKVGDIYFIVMELITGRTLRDVLRHCGSTTGPMPVPIALNILNQICDALDYARSAPRRTFRRNGRALRCGTLAMLRWSIAATVTLRLPCTERPAPRCLPWRGPRRPSPCERGHRPASSPPSTVRGRASRR